MHQEKAKIRASNDRNRNRLRLSGRRRLLYPRAQWIVLAGIGAARQCLADPDWFLKVRLGRGAEAVVCEYTNYCEALDQKHVPVTCKLWDRKNKGEPGIALTPDSKRRLNAPLWEPDLDIDMALTAE